MVSEMPQLGLPFAKDRLRQLTRVYTPPECRRRGDMRWLLCEVVLEADRERTVLVLEPDPFEESPLDADALELLYRKFGFQTIQREPVVLMARQPR